MITTTITDRIDNITHIKEQYKNTVLPPPKSVKIELTANCNFKCFFCATEKKLRPQGPMDFELYKRLAKEMRLSGVEELGLFYLGESFLYKQLPDAVRWAKEDCGYPYVFLTTNGHLCKPDKVRAVMEAGLDSLKFSFNWASPAQCVEITRVDAFERVVGHIKEARKIRDEIEKKTGHRCGLYASSIHFDGEQQHRMEEAVSLIRDSVDEHYFLPLYQQGGFVTKDEQERGLEPQVGNRGRMEALVDPLPCWALFQEGHVSWDGVLTGCCFSHTPDFDFGDMKNMHFMEAWNSESAQNLRHAHLNMDVTGTPCEHCFSN